ncbi:hypothetical protein Q1Z72_01470 [Pseudomonas qingdaonensis]|uniref:hypothetical protein n=1 Tax=Pseudomonas TaxID=286 RepID=UPI0021C1E1E5|nr:MULTISPECIES: hypothetical protein [Pseudomonas]UXH55933.1 hypothetical protein N5876_32820 [Pseudomonas aeruginosa]UXH68977.1 hypothetical protein N5879_32260 [Pseudomonas aeruginosa]WKL67364.1 hypothetical protein Q1Z72_01470 [Pseudomonas qingdaonensis]
MAKQARLPGLDHLQIDGEYFSWNESFDEYWSDSGEPRVLQEGEIAAWRVQFNTLRGYTPQGQEIEAKILSWQLCPLEGRDVYKLGFIDRSRGICGTVQVAQLIPAAVMREYDAGRYEGLWTGAYENLGFVGRV